MLLLIDRSPLPLIPIAAAILHECGHLAAMRLFGVVPKQIELTFFGMEIRTDLSVLGSFRRGTVFFAGAAVNLISCAFVYFSGTRNFELCFFGVCSLSLAVLNLLPISTLDGGCILKEIAVSLAPVHAHTIIKAVSAVTLFILWLCSVYLLLICGGNLSMMLFCIYLFSELFIR